ncbi:MAG TPA: hypothetical protein PKE55_11540 [Kiritimatiellia bacterium]|nr:hypothetical protein [Kiritimatiellia bacterium]
MILIILAHLGWAGFANGTEYVWTGAGSTTNWFEAENWMNNEAPPVASPLTRISLPGGTPSPYVSEATTIHQLTLTEPSGTHVLRGATIRFEGEEPGIWNAGSANQFILCQLETTGMVSVVSRSAIHLSGAVSGEGGLGLTANEFASIFLNPSSDNLYTGPTEVSGLVTVNTGSGSIAIPGDLVFHGGAVYLYEHSISSNSIVHFMDAGWLNVLGENRVGSFQGKGLLAVGSDLRIVGTNEIDFAGDVIVGARLIKETPSIMRLSGSVLGYGRLAGNLELSGRVHRDAAYPGTLHIEGDCALAEGLNLDFDLGMFVTGPLLGFEAGALHVTSPTGVVINVYDTGLFDSGSYVLMDWSGAVESTVELGDFQLGEVVDGYTYDLRVEDARLILDVIGPSRRHVLQSMEWNGSAMEIRLDGDMPEGGFYLEGNTTLLDPEGWESLLFFDFEEGVQVPEPYSDYRYFRVIYFR